MDEEFYNDFRELVLKEIPLLDVRAPIEFEKGAFKTSVNLPLMNNEERHKVGTEYKQKGNSEAVKLGHALVKGTIKEERIEAWRKYLEENPTAILNCARGGLRSQIAQQWIKEEVGKEIPRIKGGYKAFRNYLIEAMNPENISMKPIVLGSYTGAGKTILLHKLANQIDLEGLANHRGSSFGGHVTPQPSQINFENNLAYALIQNQAKGFQNMILEDEGVHVGRCYLPRPLFEYINSGELVILEQPLERRVEITLDEYVVNAQQEYIESSATREEGMEAWYAYISGSISRLKKRLGGARHQEMLGILQAAYEKQLNSGETKAHQEWIELLLRDYYDPMYQYQIDNNVKPIVFRGNEAEVLEYLKGRQ